MPLRLLRRRQRQVERLGREPPLELGGFERRLALGDRVGDRFAQRVDLRRLGGARVRVHRAERLQQRGDLARLAERRDAQLLERGEVGRAADLVEKVRVDAMARPLAVPQRKMQRPVLRSAAMSDWPELERRARPRDARDAPPRRQMLGKIRVAHAPWANHGWHVALQPNARGLATLPTAAGDGRTFTLTLDLCRHAIVLGSSDEAREELPLNAGSIAALHQRLVAMLDRHGLPSTFNGTPNEIADAVPFAEDTAPRDYDRDSAERLARSAGGDRAGVRALPRRLHRQGEPGAFLLGQLRPRGDPLLGPDGAAAPGRRARPARPHHARGL